MENNGPLTIPSPDRKVYHMSFTPEHQIMVCLPTIVDNGYYTKIGYRDPVTGHYHWEHVRDQAGQVINFPDGQTAHQAGHQSVELVTSCSGYLNKQGHHQPCGDEPSQPAPFYIYTGWRHSTADTSWQAIVANPVFNQYRLLTRMGLNQGEIIHKESHYLLKTLGLKADRCTGYLGQDGWWRSCRKRKEVLPGYIVIAPDSPTTWAALIQDGSLPGRILIYLSSKTYDYFLTLRQADRPVTQPDWRNPEVIHRLAHQILADYRFDLAGCSGFGQGSAHHDCPDKPLAGQTCRLSRQNIVADHRSTWLISQEKGWNLIIPGRDWSPYQVDAAQRLDERNARQLVTDLGQQLVA